MGRFCPFRCRCLLLKFNLSLFNFLAIYRNTPSFAPLPSEVIDRKASRRPLSQVLWDNIRSKRSYYLGQVFFNLILIFLVVICSTPGRLNPRLYGFWQKMFQRASSRGCRGCWVGREAGTVEPPPSSPLSSCSSSWYVLVVQLCSSQAQFHQVLVPLTVKFTTVFYGHPTRCFSHSAYQVQPLQLVVKARIRFSAGAALLMADRLLSHLPHHHQQRRQPFRPLEGVNLSSSKEDSEMSLKSSNLLRTSDFDTCALCRR